MRYAQRPLLLAVLFFFVPIAATAQVTTSTLIGIVRDTSAAVVPGATVLARHEGTGVARNTISDANGEFVLSALPTGSYLVTIELVGFRSLTSRGLQLGAGQTVRQIFTLELGAMAETVTVAGEAPLVETSTSLQADSIGTQEVRELPVNRRNLVNLMGLTAGVNTSGAGDVQMNGVAGAGTGITVDGTEANSSPLERSLGHYGGNNQISVMSLDAVAEIQIVKGVLPAEYGGVAGGQINVISRSGTNAFHGSSFFNLQNEKWNARDFFSTSAKPTGTFDQFGGTLGGPVLRNRVFFFAAYEGYREEVGRNLSLVVPTQSLRNEVLGALPFPETKMVLDIVPLPTEPVLTSAGVVDADIGRWRGVRTQRRTENHVVAKADVAVFNGANLAVTYTRMRPFHLEPRAFLNNANDRLFPNEQDRIAAQLVMARGSWVSESRVGWNATALLRSDAFMNTLGPNQPAEILAYGRRVGRLSTTNLFATADAEIWDQRGRTYSFEQKLSRVYERHVVKVGIRYARETGGHENPEIPKVNFRNKADLLANRPLSVNTSFGAPPYDSRMDTVGGFLQDDWRLRDNFVLNIGLRYDYFGNVRVFPTTPIDVEFVNFAPPTDLRKMDFGDPVDPRHPYNPDAWNFAPRVGFAWTLDEAEQTVVRGGVGYLYSPHMAGLVRSGVGNPFIPRRTIYNAPEAAARGMKWPWYTDQSVPFVVSEAGGRKTVFSLYDTHLPVPYTIQSMASVQKGLGRTMAMEVGYVHTDGRSFPVQRQLSQAIDRETGLRPNPALGAPGGYYVDSSQTMVYNGLQTALRKRFANAHSWEVNYTLSKGEATQGGDFAHWSLADVDSTQDFWDPEFDRGPVDNDVRHRMTGTFIYELPRIRGSQGVLNGILGGWQVSGIVNARTGLKLRVTQPSGIERSRPDAVPGVDPVLEDWKDSCTASGCNYLNGAAFALVPESRVTGATLRPGTSQVGAARGPAFWTLHTTLAKSFPIGGGRAFQVRADAFNVLNVKNFDHPVLNIKSPEFGRITGASGERVLQFGGRLTF